MLRLMMKKRQVRPAKIDVDEMNIEKLQVDWPGKTPVSKKGSKLSFFARVHSMFEFNMLVPALAEGRRRQWHSGVIEAIEKDCGLRKKMNKVSKVSTESFSNAVVENEETSLKQ